MEIYDIQMDEWSVLDEKLPIRLSNHACISTEENKVLILGGGSVDGFSHEIYSFDLQTRVIDKTGRMPSGRDLRNKVFSHGDEVFVVGGNKSCSGEKLNLNTSRWSTLRQYSLLVKDPLDSWYSVLVYQNPLLHAREPNAMLRIVEKLPAHETHVNHPGWYDDYGADDQSDELDANAYHPPLRHNMFRPFHHLENFNYDEEISVNQSMTSEDDDADHPI